MKELIKKLLYPTKAQFEIKHRERIFRIWQMVKKQLLTIYIAGLMFSELWILASTVI